MRKKIILILLISGFISSTIGFSLTFFAYMKASKDKENNSLIIENNAKEIENDKTEEKEKTEENNNIEVVEKNNEITNINNNSGNNINNNKTNNTKSNTTTKKTTNKVKTLAHIVIPTYNQRTSGYRLGCEGVSLYMALRGLGYATNYSLDDFMNTMPKGETPYEGFSGNPTIGHFDENEGKRTTIYPEPLTKWASNFASSKNLTGASVDTLKKELKSGHVLLVYVTTAWQKPIWKKYTWSKTSKGEVENNHCLAVVGYNSNGDFLVNDCHDGRDDGRQGEYWVKAKTFNSIYNARKYAISVY